MREPKALPYLLIAPSALFLTGLFLIPLAQTAVLAFQESGGAWGLGNLRRMTDELNFPDALANTFKVVLLAVPLQLVLALGMTMALRNIRRGRDLLVWVWSIPLGISDLAAGLVWLAILNDQGWLNSALFRLGLIAQPQAWLTYETPAALLAAIVIAEIWRATAIVFVILLAGVQLLPKEYEEAADVFGATPWQRFFRITVPLLKPSIQTALILRTVLAFEMFAMAMALGGRNFPVLVSEAFNAQYFSQDYGVAAAYAVLVMTISVAATVLYLVALRVPAEQR
ncbi:MAG: sugar ABC transporter permease [Bosea sp.]|uniref:carbohydrate ABC transporter permease n=1 Tax=unclassified Bosea (in: a-proteobacteria) TaxID=2653178 RepID=UPI000964CE87|nr:MULTISPECIES: sugar ABC transporter permease [unclassified Bosea (in: a-proteobacteria)]MBN9459241.1 sugar ABC transporter permease [Bosea sp. (in: a-proteobacteria)]OJV07578.1 MAG: ABC transporter permease [Bosea sp. 67-29]